MTLMASSEPRGSRPAAAFASDLRQARDGLTLAQDELAVLAEKPGEVGTDAWECTNLLTVSSALAAAAAMREETRGSHWREDFPARDDAHWSGHFDVSLDGSSLAVSFTRAEPSDGGLA